MKSSEGLHFKTFILLLLMVTFGPLGDAFLGKGMRRVDSAGLRTPSDLFHFFLRAFSSGTVWTGVLLLVAFFTAYTLVLSWADFSFVQPASSFAYAIVALLGHYFLGEFVSTTRWIGILIICLGVFCVGTTPPSTTERA
ncbi:MAG TPA: EamA family transporter [Candidatus Acidoferrales bacterium]